MEIKCISSSIYVFTNKVRNDMLTLKCLELETLLQHEYYEMCCLNAKLGQTLYAKAVFATLLLGDII